MRALLLTTGFAIACAACTGREKPAETTPAASTVATPATVAAAPPTATVAPAAASPLAIAWPIPEVEPVTSAVFPERSIFMRHLHH